MTAFADPSWGHDEEGDEFWEAYYKDLLENEPDEEEDMFADVEEI